MPDIFCRVNFSFVFFQKECLKDGTLKGYLLNLPKKGKKTSTTCNFIKAKTAKPIYLIHDKKAKQSSSHSKVKWKENQDSLLCIFVR